jgi:hypothetical protein
MRRCGPVPKLDTPRQKRLEDVAPARASIGQHFLSFLTSLSRVMKNLRAESSRKRSGVSLLRLQYCERSQAFNQSLKKIAETVHHFLLST